MAALSSMSWRQTLTPAPSQAFVLSCLPAIQTTTIAHTFSPFWNDGSLSRSGSPQRQHRVSRVSCGLGGVSSEEERWQREEARWMREEQRWMRDESRWQREEARWNEERKVWAQEAAVMAEEMTVLKQEIEELRVYAEEKRLSTASLSNSMAGLKNFMESLNARPNHGVQDLTSVSRNPTSIIESSDSDEISEEEILVEMDSNGSIPSMSEFSIDLVMDSSRGREGTNSQIPSSPALIRALKRGAEGDMVKALHEALAAAGFYSEEDEIEYSSFSHSTESAVKSWQASIGAIEDGIVTTELFEILLGKSNSFPSTSGSNNTTTQGAAFSTNGTTTEALNSHSKSQQPSVPPGISNPWGKPPDVTKRPRTSQPSKATQKPEFGQTFAEKKREIDGTLEQDISLDRRVFLLGENRWEEPSRLVQRTNGKLYGQKQMVTLKCFSCRGELVTMCTECEGTGDLNVEDQFLEWVDEGAKCPYCEGSGAVPCDVCEGIGAVAEV